MPLLGLNPLWRGPRRLFGKLASTVGWLFYSLMLALLLVALLLRFVGGEPSFRATVLRMYEGCRGLLSYVGAELEWRGGYVPAITWHKTTTDLEALARNRSAQSPAARPAATTSDFPAPYWTGFRGPRRDGHYTEQPILTAWPANGLRQLWKQPCGGGYSSFAIANGLAYTLEQRGSNEVAVAYEVETGHELWTNAWPARFSEVHSDEGPRATPEFNEARVYTLGATGELRCLRAADGTVIWRKNIVEDNQGKVPMYGIAASPLIVDEKLIVQNYSTGTRSVACYHKLTGQLIWTSSTMTMGWTSPMLMDLGTERQIVLGGRPDVFGVRVDDGAIRWSAPFPIVSHERPVAQPLLAATNRILFSASYMTGGTLFEIVRTNDQFAAREVWKSRRIKTRFAGTVYWEGFIYGLDEEILTCIDAASGEAKWKDGRYGYGQVLLASGHLIVQCADGDLALVKATPEKHIELARFPAIQGKSWNVPALANGRLLVRNIAEMACFDISVPATGRP